MAWSNTTRLFQKVSGMFSTFHAGYPMFRWPLDHVFHDRSFALGRLRRLRSIGSGHFPVLAGLQLEPAAADQAAPEPERKDLEDAGKRIAEGRAAE